MKVLQVNCVYKKGSTGKIVHDIHTQLLAQGHESIVCYGRGEVIQEPGVYKTCGEFYSHVNHFWANLTGIMYGGCFFSTNKLISIIRKEKPDVVHLQCINGYFVNIYRLAAWLRKNRIKTVLTLHAEFMYTGGCGHSIECEQWCADKQGCRNGTCPHLADTGSWFFDRTGTMWKKMYVAFQEDWPELTITSVSPWLKERAEQSLILQGKKHCVVLNGTDPSVFHPYDQANAAQWKHKLGISDEKVVFHATPNFNDEPNHLKGGYYVLELAKRMPKVRFVVAGPAKEGMDIPENVTLLGHVGDQNQLAQLYSMADVTLLTSQRETFSMVVAESLCCGTPVVGFKAGAPEMIALKAYSIFVDYADVVALENALEIQLQRVANRQVLTETSRVQFSRENMVKNYLSVYNTQA